MNPRDILDSIVEYEIDSSTNLIKHCVDLLSTNDSSLAAILGSCLDELSNNSLKLLLETHYGIDFSDTVNEKSLD